MAICRNHCVLLHCFLSSRSDAVDDSNGYCIRNLVRCWNRINQPFGLVGKWAKAGFPGDRRHVPDLRWGSGYQYFFKIFPALILKECRISGAVSRAYSCAVKKPAWYEAGLRIFVVIRTGRLNQRQRCRQLRYHCFHRSCRLRPAG